MTLRLSVDLDGLTWGDLYGLADSARGAGVPPTQRVEQAFAEQDDAMVVALQVDLPEIAGGRSLALTSDERSEFTDALEAVIRTDGDGRHVLDELRALRDRLLGG